MGMELSDIFVGLEPKEEWQTACQKEELVEKMAAGLARECRESGLALPSRSRCASTS